MKGTIHNPGQPHKKANLDHTQDSLEESIRERTLDIFTPGILADSQFGAESIPFEITPDGGLTVKVGTGVAAAPHDTSIVEQIDAQDAAKPGGERVFIPTADTVTSPANVYARDINTGPGDGSGTGPYTESPDGLGGWVSTPQSTKTRNIPLVNGALNRLWISYLNTIDPSVTALHKVNTSQILYPKSEDGYEIVVNQSGTPPGGDQKYEFLGTVDLTSSPGTVTSGMISHSGRRFSMTKPGRVGIALDTALSPASYDDTTRTITAEDHVNGFGTGTVTPTNVHGLTLADLGFTEDVDLLAHRLNHHSNGVITPSPASVSSALYPLTDTSTPEVGDAAMVVMRKLSTNESLLMNGTVFDSVTPSLAVPLGSGFAGDAYVSFGTSHSAGVYAIVIKQSGSSAVVEKRVSPYAFDPKTEFLVCTVQWTGTAFTSPITPGVQTDNRLFGSISNKDMQEDSVSTGNIQDLAVTTSKLADLSVTTGKYADLSITTGKYADTSVTTGKLADLGVATGKIADSAVTSQKIAVADGVSGQTTSTGSGVKTNHIQDDAVTSAKLDEWDGASTASQPDIGSGVATDHIKDEAVTLAKLAAAVQSLISSGASPVGSITAFAGTTPPSGWLECTGEPVARVGTYANLFTAIGVTWGSGDGSTTFNLPDLRGSFLRGRVGVTSKTFSPSDVDTGTNEITITGHGFHHTGFQVRFTTSGTLPAPLVATIPETNITAYQDYYVIVVDADTIKLATTRANALGNVPIDITSQGTGTHTIYQNVDPDASSRESIAPGGSSGDAVGSAQDDQFQNHTHESYQGPGPSGGNLAVNAASNAFYTTSSTGGNDTRPKNASVMYIIRY